MIDVIAVPTVVDVAAAVEIRMITMTVKIIIGTVDPVILGGTLHRIIVEVIVAITMIADHHITDQAQKVLMKILVDEEDVPLVTEIIQTTIEM